MGKGDKSIRTLAMGVATVAAAIAAAAPARASEGGASFYLLGSGGPGAAELPPVTGLFFDNTLYYYTAQSSGSREFVVGGNVVAGLELDLVADFATVMWVPSTDVLGGTLAVGGAFAVGRPEVGVDAILTGPRGNSVALHVDDSATIIGDPVVLGELSWKVAPKLHAAVAGTLNIPVGHYREGELANVSFHRWIFDASAALTWKDEETGWDVSGKAGLTFNGENEDTDYDTGTEFHIEGSVEKTFLKQFSIGLQAYYFRQITGDSGEGATLGPYKGRVTGIGPTAAFHFPIGKTPVTARVRWFKELGVKNRPEGNAAFFSLSFPLKMNLPAGAGAHAE